MACPAIKRCEEPESDLISEARNGDEGAMAELFRRHYTHSVAVARRILPAQEEFLDAVQSAYLSAFLNFQSLRAEASFKTWITRIVRDHCLMRLRPSSGARSAKSGRILVPDRHNWLLRFNSEENAFYLVFRSAALSHC